MKKILFIILMLPFLANSQTSLQGWFTYNSPPNDSVRYHWRPGGLGHSVFVSLGQSSNFFGSLNATGLISTNTNFTVYSGGYSVNLTGSQFSITKPTPGTYNFQTSPQTTATNSDHILIATGGYSPTGNASGGNITIQPGTKSGSGTQGFFILKNVPTSSAGLPSGAVWSNAGILSIVP